MSQAYASRSLLKSERNYPVHKLEFLAFKWPVTYKFHEYLYGSEFQVFTDNNPLTYVLTTAKLDATGHRWVAALSNYIRWPEAIDIDTKTVHAVCKGAQAQHGKVETLCQGAQVVDALCQDNAPPGMTPLEWCQAQAKDPAIHHIVESIQNKALKTSENTG